MKSLVMMACQSLSNLRPSGAPAELCPDYDLCYVRYMSAQRLLALAVIAGSALDILAAARANLVWVLELLRGADEEENDGAIADHERDVAVLERYLASGGAPVSTAVHPVVVAQRVLLRVMEGPPRGAGAPFAGRVAGLAGLAGLEGTRAPGLVRVRPWVHAAQAGLAVGQKRSRSTNRPAYSEARAEPYRRALNALGDAVFDGHALEAVLEAAFAVLRTELALLRAERDPDRGRIAEFEAVLAHVAPG
jgi:hypothetical protein